jgi:acetolactate synthase I/II/III large subunit
MLETSRPDAARVIQVACSVHGQIASLVLPADTAWDDAGERAYPMLPVTGPAPVSVGFEGRVPYSAEFLPSRAIFI